MVLLCGCTEQTDRCLELNTDLKYVCQEQSGVCSVCDAATGGEVIAKIPRRHISQKKFRLKLGIPFETRRPQETSNMSRIADVERLTPMRDRTGLRPTGPTEAISSPACMRQ